MKSFLVFLCFCHQKLGTCKRRSTYEDIELCNSDALYNLWVTVQYMLSPGQFRANYYMCLGEDPRKDPYDHGKVRKCT